MAFAILPHPKQQFLDGDGNPYVGGKLYFYEPGTSTLKDTYTDDSGVTPNANPVILDADGRAEVWLNGIYDVTLKDSTDTLVWTVENISNAGATSDATVFTEWFSPGDTPTYIDADEFSVTGDKRTTYQVGRRVKVTVTAGTLYGVISAVAYTTLTTVTVILDSGTLDSGLSAVDIGILSVTNPSLPTVRDATLAGDIANAGQIQKGGLLYTADSGAADAYVITLAPAITVYTTGMLVGTKIVNANLTTTPTLNVNGIDADTIKRPDGTALQANDLPANHWAVFRHDGIDWILQNPALLPVIALRDTSRNLVITRPTAATIDIDADEVILQDTNGKVYRAASVNLTVDITASGANGLDTGSEAIDTWYYIWIISNGATVAGLLSTSSTAPTMPSGYTYKALVGETRNDGSSDLLDFRIDDDIVEFAADKTIKDGSFAVTTRTALAITDFFPPTAKRIFVYMASSVNGRITISPRTDGHAGAKKSGEQNASTDFGGILPTARGGGGEAEIRYVSSLYYWTDAAASILTTRGYKR